MLCHWVKSSRLFDSPAIVRLASSPTPLSEFKYRNKPRLYEIKINDTNVCRTCSRTDRVLHMATSFAYFHFSHFFCQVRLGCKSMITQTTKAYGGMAFVQLCFCLNSALYGDEWPVSSYDRFTSQETAPGSHCIYLSTGLDNVEKRKSRARTGKRTPIPRLCNPQPGNCTNYRLLFRHYDKISIRKQQTRETNFFLCTRPNYSTTLSTVPIATVLSNCFVFTFEDKNSEPQEAQSLKTVNGFRCN